MSTLGVTHSFDQGDGRTISIETGKLAKQADGSVVVTMGKTMLLATVVSAHTVKEGQGFFPLIVDFQEKFAGAGRIPGSFQRREGRLNDDEILVSRLVDRALRPLFPDGYLFDTQVIINVISLDPEVKPDALAAFAASCALSVSDIPFQGPISEVRVARVNGEHIVNPTTTQLAEADLDIMLAASSENIVMVEGEAQEVQEEELLKAVEVGHEAIKIQCKAQDDLVAKIGGVTKREFIAPEENEEIYNKVNDFCRSKIYEVAKGGLSKPERKEGFAAVKDALKEQFTEEELEENGAFISKYFSKVEKDTIRKMVADEKIRLDGRRTDEIRPIWMEVDYLPNAHGSAVFTRGETQSLTTVTLGGKRDEQMIDRAAELTFSDFMLHYNFPPYCTGEVKMQRGTSRREVGHGNLAHRSVKRILPPEEENSYTIRIVSDILESNGSSSMATVCAGSLALHDAGIKVSNHVSGIAMGLIKDEDSGNIAVLSDILGDEDHLGDMDFKVTGTKNGICACQMDIKLDGLTFDILKDALTQAKEGRLHILDLMEKSIEAPREEMKSHVPRIEKIYVDKEDIGAIIGPGGKVIQELQKETGTTISIEEKDDKGEVVILSTDGEGMKAALAKIKGITMKAEVGEVYEAKVASIMPYGAFVDFLPGQSGLLHISEISHSRLENMDGVLEVGDMVKVKLVGVDKRSGKFKLSRKVLMPKPEAAAEGESAE